jgi:hypothetical protein
MSDEVNPLGAGGIDEREDVCDQFRDAIGRASLGPRARRVPTLVRRQAPIALLGERLGYRLPALGELRETVQPTGPSRGPVSMRSKVNSPRRYSSMARASRTSAEPDRDCTNLALLPPEDARLLAPGRAREGAHT